MLLILTLVDFERVVNSNVNYSGAATLHNNCKTQTQVETM